MTTNGQPIWTDLGTPDVPAARDFYAAVMGWRTTEGDPAFGGYATAFRGEQAVAGIGPLATGAPPAWLLYFSTADAEHTAGLIEQSGGSIIMPPHRVAEMGRLVVAQDTTGAVFGLWEAGTMSGFDATGAPGAWAWCDLRSPEPDAAREFYGSVFGWEYAAVPMAGDEYTTFTVAGQPAPAGGVGPMMGADGAPAHWLNYFAVADVDASAAAAERLGGRMLVPPFDTAFGRMAPIQDPATAAMIIMQLPSA